METFDSQLNDYFDYLDETYECTECMNEVAEEGTQCSPECKILANEY